jgi:hypothetical protein
MTKDKETSSRSRGQCQLLLTPRFLGSPHGFARQAGEMRRRTPCPETTSLLAAAVFQHLFAAPHLSPTETNLPACAANPAPSHSPGSNRAIPPKQTAPPR